MMPSGEKGLRKSECCVGEENNPEDPVWMFFDGKQILNLRDQPIAQADTVLIMSSATKI
jgi:hypothetical protein